MLSITHENVLVGAMVTKHDTKFKESQLLRMEALAALKSAGDALIQIRAKLKAAGAGPNNPVETDLGTFTSFDEYVKSGMSGVKKTAAYDYINLAENWDIVLKLGMQDGTDDKNIIKCMRLCRTLKVIKWFKQKVSEGADPDTLTLDQYWLEQEPSRQPGPSKKQLIEELESTKQELSTAYLRIKQLEAEVQKLKNHDARLIVPSIF